MAKLQSDLVVQYKSSWIENNTILYIQMELCLNTLKEIIEILNKELNQKQSEVMTPLGYCISSEIFVEILESVDYLHKQNVIHRDLKPTNILITNGLNGRFIKLADFGLSKIHESEYQTHTKYVGSLGYVAPEVQQTKQYDTKADIYSLGIIVQQIYNIDINEY
jgi:serine/threonine protein kinase